jgi:hypothetical protein
MTEGGISVSGARLAGKASLAGRGVADIAESLAADVEVKSVIHGVTPVVSR